MLALFTQKDSTIRYAQAMRDQDSILTVVRHYLAAKAFQASSRIRTLAVNAGDIAQSENVIRDLLGFSPPVLRTREQLWGAMCAEIPSESRIQGLEFGVAAGTATSWWLQHLPGEDLRWVGFDTFTGNPQDWRSHKVGTWDNNGQTPDLADSRVAWVPGDVSSTFRVEDLAVGENDVLIVLLDLNLEEPTRHVLNQLTTRVLPRAQFYFDDFFDPSQRELALSLFFTLGGCHVIGRTAKAFAFAYTPVMSRDV